MPPRSHRRQCNLVLHRLRWLYQSAVKIIKILFENLHACKRWAGIFIIKNLFDLSMANPFKNKGSSGSSDPMYLFQKHPSNTSEPFGSIFSANPSPAFGNQDATKTADNTKLFSGNTFSSSIFTSTNTMFTSPPNSNDPPKQDPIK